MASPPSSTLRAHLAHLLPRQALFLVRITLHDLHNVPLVHGHFGVTWKLSGVTSGGILAKVNRTSKPRPKPVSGQPALEISHSNDSDSVPPRDTDVDDASASVSDTHSIANSSSTHSYSYDHSLPYHPPSTTPLHLHPLSIPSVVVSANGPPTPIPRTLTAASSNPGASTSSYNTSSPDPHLNQTPSTSPSFLSPDWLPQAPSHSPPFDMHPPNSRALHRNEAPTPPAKAARPLSQSDSSIPSLASTPPRRGYTPAKGHTPFMKLKEHNVTWEQTLDFVVQMRISRERDKRDKGELNPSEAKLVVMQRVIPGDPDAPHNPRLGAVYLNLAQYVDAGAVTRRYLLRQSKTNATLKLTVHVEHTAGSTAYIAPPLPKGEILSGVAGLLESSDAYTTRFRTLDLYRDALSNSSSDEENPSDASSALSVDDNTHFENTERGIHEKRKHGNKKRSPFDVTKLPSINDARGTQKLIEALFNPAPVMSPHLISPFTYLVGAERGAELEGGNGGDGELDQTSLDGNGKFELEGESLDMDDDAGASLYADTLEEMQQNSESESDYRSIGSYHSASFRGPGDGESLGKKSLRSVGSRLGLRLGDGVKNDGAGSASGTEGRDGTTGTRGAKRGWWQKLKPGQA